MEAGQGVIWDRFAPVLRGLVEKSNGFGTVMEAFRSKISGRYFVKCANVAILCWRMFLKRHGVVFDARSLFFVVQRIATYQRLLPTRDTFRGPE